MTRRPTFEGEHMAFRRSTKTRAHDIGADLSASVEHLRSAAATATDAAREALGPRVEAARDTVAPRMDAARDSLVPRLEAAKDAMAPRVDAARDAVKPAWDTVRPAWDTALAALAPLVATAVEAQSSGKKRGKKALAKAEHQTRKQRREAARRTKNVALALRGERPARRWPWVIAALSIGAAAGAAAGLVKKRADDIGWEEYNPVSKAEDVKAKVSDTTATLKAKAADVAGAAKERLISATDTVREQTAAVDDEAPAAAPTGDVSIDVSEASTSPGSHAKHDDHL